jgi:hypothetical protein
MAPAVTDPERTRLVTVFEHLAVAAGKATMEVYAGPIDVERKADASPVTEAAGDLPFHAGNENPHAAPRLASPNRSPA